MLISHTMLTLAKTRFVFVCVMSDAVAVH